MKCKYDYEAGKIFDACFYLVVRFFEDVMIERVFTKFAKVGDLEYDMRFYNEIKSRCPDISEDLTPFFYCNPDQPAFLIRFVTDHINFDNGTLKELKFLLQTKSKPYFIDTYFPKLSLLEREKLCVTKDLRFINSIIEKSEIEAKYHSKFLILLAEYKTYIPLLIEAIELAHAYTDRLHVLNTEFIQSIIGQLNDPAVNAEEKLLRYFALTEEKQIVFTFSLLNPYGVHFWRKPHHHPFRVGEKFLRTLAFESDYNHVNYKSFAKVLAGVTKVEIFNMFLEYNQLCAGDIIEATGLSRYAVYSHLDEMLYEKVIVYVDSGGSALRYAINEDYIYKFNEYSTKRIEKYTELKRRDGLKYYVRPRKRRKDAQE